MLALHRLYPAVLGFALVLHGLALSVLPLRGSDASAAGTLMPTLTLLYVVATIGFTAAGLGVLGVCGLRLAVVPAALSAGLAALAAQFRQADADLWPGVVLSASLPLLATLHAAAPGEGRTRHTRWHLAGDAIGVAFLVWVSAASLLWPWHRSWGTDPSEWTLALPGDRSPRAPALEIMHAVTIDAAPDAVWPWLVQLGQDRAGFYSYAWLERAFGAQITNSDTIRPEWQSLRAGDRVYATQSGYLASVLPERPGWVVDRVEPGRVLVLRNWGAFVLQPTAEGRTRFLIRSTISNERIPAWAAAINFTAFELPHFIMQRRMMLGIKERAERAARG
jgi:hypothetical protein